MTINPDRNQTPAPVVNCAYCIDGLRPGKVDPYMGPIYLACIHCGPDCLHCDGASVFPAGPAHLPDFFASLYAKGWIPTFCPGCLGVTVLTELSFGDASP